MNLLINETSPYLLQHAQNPVHWHPWGDAALQKAKAENKPILVSIGYAACHWCHVMERESFEDESTAAIMNEYFINIKVDREERPDVDHIYMDAVQAMTGSGGWPLNVFLTPDAKPFYGGTYFPPVAMYNRGSWKDVLQNVHDAFTNKRNEMDAQAENLTAHLLNANSFGQNTKEQLATERKTLQTIADNILTQADKKWGGFGRAPKFPQTYAIQFLLRHNYFTKDENALQQALLSLDKMIYGGIYDQAGGGFSRYSVDEEWHAAHFEKMLYDNALLLGVLSEAYQLTNKKLYADVIRQTTGFLQREMLNDEGGFYSALDADSEGVEGKFYTWGKAEIDEILQDEAELFCKFYNVTEDGNWEHTNILRILKPLQAFALENNLSEAEVESSLNSSLKKILQQRTKRIRPATDDKIILGWNALTITALCKAYNALDDESFLTLAEANFSFLKNKLSSNNGWLHTYKNSHAKINAFLDDYAYTIQACIALQEATANQEYLEIAKQLTEFVINNFIDDETGYFYYTPSFQNDIIVRKKEVYDGATPSGNAIMAQVLQYLSVVFDKPQWAVISNKIIDGIFGAVIRYPTSFGAWAAAIQTRIIGLKEITVTGCDVKKWLLAIKKIFFPNKILQASLTPENKYPLLKDKFKNEETIGYICENYVCKQPEYQLKNFIVLIQHINN